MVVSKGTGVSSSASVLVYCKETPCAGNPSKASVRRLLELNLENTLTVDVALPKFNQSLLFHKPVLSTEA